MNYKLLFVICTLVATATSVELGPNVRQHSANKIKNQPLMLVVRQVSCANAGVKSLVEHPSNCQSYYYCATRDSAPVHQTCPTHLHFNANQQMCDYPEYAGCDARRANSTHRPDQPVHNQFPLRCLLQPAKVSCDNVGEDSLVPHPGDCNLFYYCLPNIPPICRQCPGHLHFSPTSHVCEYPQNAGCGNKSFTSPRPNSTNIDITEMTPSSTETLPDTVSTDQASTNNLVELITPLNGGSIVTEILPDTTAEETEPLQFDETTLSS